MGKYLEIVKCPYCGSVDKLIEVDNHFKCSYCDCIMYPVNDEVKMQLNQAHGYISRYKFDDADDIYRSISRKADEDGDYKLYVMAEWGRLLAYFGVVYVRSFEGNVSVPTITKYDSRVKSVKHCEHYINIMDSDASDDIKNKYKKMAYHLDETYSRIGIELAKTPEYDVFLCVKISLKTEKYPDIDGYTKDSRLADTIFNELEKRGFKVFYSDRCCQGIEYDSQILSALSRSRMLLVITTKKEYLESAWVESEWRRWLTFIKWEDKKKNSLLLYIPNYDLGFDLPSVLTKRKIQYFDNSIDVINHIEKTIKEMNEENSNSKDDRINKMFKELEELKKFKQDVERNNANQNSTSGSNELKKDTPKVNTENKTDSDKKGSKFEVPLVIGEYASEEEKKERRRLLDELRIDDLNWDGRKAYEKKNYKEAFKYYEEAATLGSKEAYNALGDMYYNGYGVEQDYGKARSYYKEAANEFSNSAYMLGCIYRDGTGIYKNIDTAKKYFEIASKNGSKEAATELEKLNKNIESKQGINQNTATRNSNNTVNNQSVDQLMKQANIAYNALNYKEALKLYLECDKLGSSDADNKLGDMYYYGYGVEKNRTTAIKYYKKAANDIGHSAYSLGFMYKHAQGVEKDDKEALKWYLLADTLGNVSADNDLGDIYYYGIGVDVNYSTAIEYYKKAADTKANSAYMLGYIYNYGKGVDKNIDLARKYYEIASKNGSKEAITALEKLNNSNSNNQVKQNVKSNTPISKEEAYNLITKARAAYTSGNYKEAISLYKECKERYARACLSYEIGLCYKKLKDYREAYNYFHKAIGEFNNNAYLELAECYRSGHGCPKNQKKSLSCTKSYQSGKSTEYLFRVLD